MKRVLALILTMLIVLTILFACSAEENKAIDRISENKEPSSGQKQSGSDESKDDGIGPPSGESEFDLSNLTKQIGNKIIKTGYMEIETLEFDNATSTVIRKLKEVNGYIESSKVEGVARYKKDRGRTANYKLRVPSNSLEQFMVDAGNVGNVLVSKNDGKDISSQYYDTEARLRSLRVREDRLLAILQQANRLTDIIELEKELTDLRYEIEKLTGTLLEWDTMVDYSSLEIFIQEVKEITEEEEEEEEAESLWGKIYKGFATSLKIILEILENLLLFIIVALPFLVLFGLLGLIIYLIVKAINRKVKKTNRQSIRANANAQVLQNSGQKQVINQQQGQKQVINKQQGQVAVKSKEDRQQPSKGPEQANQQNQDKK